MKIKDLKLILSETPEGLTEKEFDELDVLIPTDATSFDGLWVSPCIDECEVAEFGIDEDSDETKNSFILVPHGFFDELKDYMGVPPELN